MRVDRMERDLQAEFSGLSWQASYADLMRFNAAVDAVPAKKRQQALEAYLKDPRDTSTGTVAIAVFVSDSMRNDKERAAVIAKASEIVTSAYKGRK